MDIIKLNTDLPVSYKKQGVEICGFAMYAIGAFYL